MRSSGPVLIAALVFLGESHACSVPVFRYALENWAPSQYELLYATDGGQPLPADVQDQARAANVHIRTVDASKELNPATRRLINDPLPRLILRYPDSTEQIPPAWGSGTLADASKVFDSPSRKQLIARLKEGYAGVVLLLLTGNGDQDESARTFLREHLPRIAERIELPKKTDDGPQVKWSAPVVVAFPVVEVPRTAEEDVFVQILLGSEDGLKDVKGPIAFPIFGRGRALCSLHGRDLEKPSELQRSLEFLCRACSCQVKKLNPGLDLLLSTDWEAPPEPTRSAIRPAFDAILTDPPPPDVTDPPDVADPPGRRPWGYVVAAAAAVVLSGIWLLRSRRRPG